MTGGDSLLRKSFTSMSCLCRGRRPLLPNGFSFAVTSSRGNGGMKVSSDAAGWVADGTQEFLGRKEYSYILRFPLGRCVPLAGKMLSNVSADFLAMTPKTEGREGNLSKRGLLRAKNVCTSKGPLKRVKKTACRMGETVCKSYILYGISSQHTSSRSHNAASEPSQHTPRT